VGYSGAEGAKNDDWLAIDCYNIGVHLLLANTRKALDIESHLLSEHKPSLPSHKDEKEYDEAFDRLLEKYPVPEDYNPAAEDSALHRPAASAPQKIPKNIPKL
jgi:hypothetical protein